MKSLYLLRHAKSSWKDGGLSDHQRPLNKRGRDSAEALARYLARLGVSPDLVLCSTAARTRETLDLIAAAIGTPRILLDPALYEAGQRQLLQQVRELPETAASVMLVAHNPGIHHLALTLADAVSVRLLPPRDGKFPTAALAHFSVVGAWAALEPGNAQAVAFVTPRDVTGGA